MIEMTCNCEFKKKMFKCGTLKDQSGVECDEQCEKNKRYLAEKNDPNHKLYFADFLVKFAQSRGATTLKIEKLLKEFYFSNEKTISFKGDLKNTKKMRFLLDIMSIHYKLQVNCFNTNKVFVVDALKTEEFMIPKVPLSKYVEMIEKKQINHRVKPFEVSITFYNLHVYNTLKDLRDQISDLSSLYYLEKINDQVYLFLWSQSDEETFY